MITETMFHSLSDVRADERATIGGKAFNCARLKQAGFPVPDGIVVPADAPDHEIAELAQDPWFDSQAADALYAVRSSGIDEDGVDHSFAGIHETQLNVPRSEVAEAVLLCRRSAATDQAAAYRRTRGLGAASGIGVLVQRMVPARSSGVAFTVNPVSGADELVVNAAPGLGEALVSGQVDPDEYIVSKRDVSVVSSRIASASGAAVLDGDQIAAVAELLIGIERHYGAPQDVEFCHDGRHFWIVQSRPVTTAARPAPAQASASVPKTGVDVEWTRANLAEVFPEQMSPQVLASYESMLNKGQRMFMGRLLAPESELGPMFKVFHGRMYMNLSQMRRVTRLAGAPAADMLRSLGHPGEIDPDEEIAEKVSFREVLEVLPDFVRIGLKDLRASSLFGAHEKRIEAMLARIAGVDPRSMSDREIWDMFEWWIEEAPQSIQVVFVMSGVLYRETRIKAACKKVGFSYERLVYPQLAAGERSVSSQQAIDLIALAGVARREPKAAEYLLSNDGRFADRESALAGTAFLAALHRFLDQYGHRGRFESDWALPRLHEDPTPALFAIREQLKGDPQDIAALTARQEADAARAWREFEARLTAWQRWTLLPNVRAMVNRLKRQYVWRERIRFDLTRMLRYERAFHLELASRFVQRGWIDSRDDYFLLRIGEIGPVIDDPAVGSSVRAIVERRKAQLACERDLHLPLLARESELTSVGRRTTTPVVSSPEAQDGELAGLCVSPGCVEAEVVVLRDPAEFASMRRGAILVTRATDPSWTPLFTLASGVIVEIGGMLSHASTIAREYGLPALANVKNATAVLRTGDRVRLDASGGRVIRNARVPR